LSLDIDQTVDLSAARLVRLAGSDFYIAPLSLRQILAIADHVPKLSGITAETMSGERLTPLAEVLWQGLRRAHPKLTRDEFLDLPIPLGELVAALPVVIEQAGGKRIEAVAGNLGDERFETAAWGALVADLVLDLNWTREQVLDQVDLLFLEELRQAWSECPPSRRLLAASLGFKPKPRPSTDYRELLAMFPGGALK
jgi:hypothetical protein